MSNKIAIKLRALLRINAGHTIDESASRLGIGRPALSKVLNGKARLSYELAHKIELTYNYSMEDILIEQMLEEYENVKMRYTIEITPSQFAELLEKVEASDD